MRNWIVLTLLACSFTAFGQPKFTIKISGNEAKSGASISGIVNVEALIDTDDLITGVEFRVVGEVRGIDASTPYEFEWDTIADKEGSTDLVIVAKLQNGQQARHTMNLNIDNQVGLGGQAHLDRANEFFRNGQTARAVLSARIALKADESLNAARTLLAQSYIREGKLREALAAADALAMRASESSEAFALKSRIHYRRARANVGEFAEEMAMGVDAAVRAMEIRTKMASSANGAEALALQADAAYIRGDYDQAANLFAQLSDGDPRNVRHINRWLQANLRAAKYREAIVIATNAENRGTADDYTFVALGLAHAMQNRTNEAASAFAKARQKNADSHHLKRAQAFLDIRDGKHAAARNALIALQNDSDNSAETAFLLTWAHASMREYDRANEQFWRTLDLDPLYVDALVLRGFESIGESARPGDEQFAESARSYFALAIKARPNHGQAQLGDLFAMAMAIHYWLRDIAADDPDQKELAYKHAREMQTRIPQLINSHRGQAWFHFGMGIVMEQAGKLRLASSNASDAELRQDDARRDKLSRDAEREVGIAQQIEKDRIPAASVPAPIRGLETLWRLLFPPMMSNP